MTNVDVRGLNCPEPVILVKKQIDKGEASIEALADSKVAVENITRLANRAGYSINVEAKKGEYLLKINKI